MSRSEPPGGRHAEVELSHYERTVLTSWTETHKKSALMLFILLALTRESGWSSQIRNFITTLTGGRLAVDEQSLHRALRRVEGLNLITHSDQPAPGTGAKRKIYELTDSGERVLAAYLNGPMAYTTTPLFLESAAAVRPGPPSRRVSAAGR
jgi:DNA-binding PadR family transcriptional regulator